MEEEIIQGILNVQTAVTTALKTSTNESLTQYEQHMYAILELDKPIRMGLVDLDSNSSCATLLEQNLMYTTNMTGYESSNCATSFNTAVAAELFKSNEVFKNNNDFNGDVQQFVVKSFVGINAFLTPDAITDNFENLYNTAKENWDSAKPNVYKLVSEMKTLITGMNVLLGRCHSDLIDLVTKSYDSLTKNLDHCKTFQSVDPASDIESLPQEMQDFIKNFPEFMFDWSQKV